MITRGDVIVKDWLFKIPESSIAFRTSASEGRENLEQPAVLTVMAVTKNNKHTTATLPLIGSCLLVLRFIEGLRFYRSLKSYYREHERYLSDKSILLYTIGYSLSMLFLSGSSMKFHQKKEKKEAAPEGSASMVFRALTNQRSVSYAYLFLLLDRGAPLLIDCSAIYLHVRPCRAAVVAAEACSGDRRRHQVSARARCAVVLIECDIGRELERAG